MNFEQLDKELHQDKGFYTQQFELNKKIQQLEKENEDIKQENYVMNGLLNGEEKEIVKDLQKLKDMQDECDTCMKQEFTLDKLEKENTELKTANREFTDDYKLQQKAINTLNNSGVKLMEENKKLKSKLANQKYLNRQEVEKIVGNNVFFDEDGDVTEAYPEDIITAICNLVLPEIDRNKITAILVGKILESDKDAVKIADEIISAMGGK